MRGIAFGIRLMCICSYVCVFVWRSHFWDIETQKRMGEVPGGACRSLRARWMRAVRHVSFAGGLWVKLTGRRRKRLRMGSVFILPRGLRGRAAEAEGWMVGSLSLGWGMLSGVGILSVYLETLWLVLRK